MKVIAINGSPRQGGNTDAAIQLMANELKQEGIQVETVQIGAQQVRGCIACGYCKCSQDNRCVITDDAVNEVALKMREADGFILGCPVYYAGVPGTMKAFLDRIFYTSSQYFRYKVAAAFAIARRTGGMDTLHQLENYLHLAQTVTAPSQYWTIAHGADKGEMLQDGEGVQVVQRNAQSMAWLLKVMEAGKAQFPLPDQEGRVCTNFIR